MLDLDALADCFRPLAPRAAAVAAAASAAASSSSSSARGTPQRASPADDDDGDVSSWLSAGAAVGAVVRAVVDQWARAGQGQLRVVLSLRAEDAAARDPILAALPHALRTPHRPSSWPVTAMPFENPLLGPAAAATATAPAETSEGSTSSADVATTTGAAGGTAGEEGAETEAKDDEARARRNDAVGLRLVESVAGCAWKDLAAAEAAVAVAEAALAAAASAASASCDTACDTAAVTAAPDEEKEGVASVSRHTNSDAGARAKGLTAAAAATEAAAVAAAREALNEAHREVRLVAALRGLAATAPPRVPASREPVDRGTGDTSEADKSEAAAWPLHPSEVLVVTSAAAEGAAARLVMDGAR